ncbi:MAG: hypothetical protein QOE65_1123 [Solirubrobacteraceae bacterium]|nr:hypothetical protein [Solirubrobacteraceae bacterium]
MGVAGAPAAAATYDVTRFDDPAPKSGSGTTPCVAGDCSLREAVISANTNPGSTINVPAGRVVLSIPTAPASETVAPDPDPEASASAGDLDLFEDTTINGSGAGTTVVDGGGVDRVFDMPFNAFEGCFTPDRKVSISGLTITGGVGELSVVDFSGQKFIGGGGIVVCGQLTLNRSVITANRAVGGGGAMVVGTNSSATIDDSTISGNTQGGGGQPGGGAILVQGPRQATIFGPAIPTGTLTMTDSTVSANTAGGGGTLAMGEGGGILNLGGTASLTNVTVSGNSAGGAGVQGFGGGIFTETTGTTTLLNSTIAGNSAAQSGSGGNLSTSNLPGGTGALDGTFALKNTIVSGGVGAAGQENCNGDGFTSQGNNLESTSQCGAAAAGDQRNTDPQLGPLADNGGPTQTRALAITSPAVNAAANAGCPAADQRGVVRPQADLCDIGAFELVWQADLAVTKAAPATLPLGQNLTSTVTVTNLGPQPAVGIALRDVLPANAPLIVATPTGACGGNPFDCVVNDLAPGASETFTITTRPRAAGTYVNTATVAGRYADPNPANNTASATTVVSGIPALRAGVAGVPLSCRRTDFTIRATATGAGAVRSLRVLLDGRQVASRPRRSYTVRIRASRLRAGLHRIVVEARGTRGQLSRRTVTFRRCPAPPRRRTGPRFTG